MAVYEKSQIEIEYDAVKFNRKVHKNVENFMEEYWNQKCSENPRLYNGSKFRLDSFQLKEKLLKIQVGITSYKELLGTHHHPNADQLLNESYDFFFKGTEGFNDEFAFMSNCLGVGAIALTKDDFFILMERSMWTGEAPGKVDRPGGHPEPDLISKDHSNLTSKQVLDEIYQSPQNELRDEINIALSDQSEPKLLGLVRDMELGGRCAFDFLIKVNLTREQVLQNYQQGQQAEADESTNLIFLAKSSVETWEIPDELTLKLTHHGLAGLRLFHLYSKIRE